MWKRVPGTRSDLTGPIGDTCTFVVGSTSTEYDWTAANWAWTCEVRAETIASTITPRPPATVDTYSFNEGTGITDTSTASVLALSLVIPAATTATWTAGATYLYAVRGINGTYGTLTFIEEGRLYTKSALVT